MTPSSSEGFLRLLEAFDRLEIPYMVAGSGASSVHGLVRMTADIDMVAAIEIPHVAALITDIQSEFYIDKEQVHTALELSRSFNVIHYRSSHKFDIFPLTADRYHQVEFGRRRQETTSIFTGEPLELAVASPEDVILSKLRWFHKGGEVSEQQWNDVLGVIAVQADKLDLPYLREWAEYLGVLKLLERAVAEGQER
jgi:hypothetical protein